MWYFPSDPPTSEKQHNGYFAWMYTHLHNECWVPTSYAFQGRDCRASVQENYVVDTYPHMNFENVRGFPRINGAFPCHVVKATRARPLEYPYKMTGSANRHQIKFLRGHTLWTNEPISLETKHRSTRIFPTQREANHPPQRTMMEPTVAHSRPIDWVHHTCRGKSEK